jgi:serine O-acetyltransferase
MFANLSRDYRRHSNSKGGLLSYIFKALITAGFRAVLLYRVGHWFRKKRMRFLGAIIERIMHHSCHCWINTMAEIGPGFLIAHVGGLVIGGNTKIGSNCDVRQNVTFGGNFSKRDEEGRSQPLIGDNVSIGAGAVIIGPIKIGSNCVVGANTVVTRDVPEKSIVLGVSARVVKKRWSESSGREL